MSGKVYFDFEDNTLKIINKTEDAIEAVVLECAAELVSATMRNSRVDTGHTKGSWKAHTHKTNDGYEAKIGSAEENAIWEEFGTGQHALNGNGRLDWVGKKPSRAFWKAYTSLKAKIISRIQNALKGL